MKVARGSMTTMRRCATIAVACLVIASCTSDDDETPDEQVALECADGEAEFNPPVELDISSTGAATAEAALTPNLQAVIAASGQHGRIIRISDVEYAVSVDDRIIHIATARQNDRGEWHPVDIRYCE